MSDETEKNTQTRRVQVIETRTPLGGSTTRVVCEDSANTKLEFDVDARNAPRARQVVIVHLEWTKEGPT